MKLQGKKNLLLLLPLSGSEAGSGDHLLLPVSPARPQEPPGGLQGICCRGCRLRRSGQQRRVSEPCSPRPLLSCVLALGHRCQKDTSPSSTFCRGPFPSPSVRLSPSPATFQPAGQSLGIDPATKALPEPQRAPESPEGTLESNTETQSDLRPKAQQVKWNPLLPRPYVLKPTWRQIGGGGGG